MTLEDIAENWYQRTHRLRAVWQNPKEHSDKKRLKAFCLWSIMTQRLFKIKEVITKRQSMIYSKNLGNIRPGGIMVNNQPFV